MDANFKPSSPTRSASLGMGRGGRSGSIGSIHAGIAATAAGGPMQPATSATPSWVLPRKTPPATVAGGSPVPAQRGFGGSGLPGQFGKISLSDPGAVNSLSHSPTNQGA